MIGPSNGRDRNEGKAANGPASIRVGAVQFISTPDDVGGNVARALDFCDRAAKRGVQILCFPECATTSMDWCNEPGGATRVFSEPVPGPTVEQFVAKAEATGMYIIMGLVERSPGSQTLYNTVFVVGPEEGYMGRYRKVLPGPLFGPGEEAPIFATRFGRIGIFICADMRSQELARLLALKGAQILFQPTCYFYLNEPHVRRRYGGKNAAQRARSMDNGLPLVIANTGRPEYVNDSRILLPDGQGPERLLARATRKEQLLVADVPIDATRNRAAEKAHRQAWLSTELAHALLAAAAPA